MKQNDSAVSEVVGVLLMLTITIILVSLVAIAMNSAVSSTEKPVSATIVASGPRDNNITFENIAGDAFVLDQIELRLSIREYPSQYATLRNTAGTEPLLISYIDPTNPSKVILLGDRFRIELDRLDLNTSSGNHLTYRFYDLRAHSPISSGEIAIP